MPFMRRALLPHEMRHYRKDAGNAGHRAGTSVPSVSISPGRLPGYRKLDGTQSDNAGPVPGAGQELGTLLTRENSLSWE